MTNVLGVIVLASPLWCYALGGFIGHRRYQRAGKPDVFPES